MPKAKLIHNPKAGNGALNNKQLIRLLKKEGYDVTYADSKKGGWDNWDEDDDIIIVAGGDGTVRKVTKKLLQRQLIDKRFPIAVLPLGTANNIASTFYAEKDVKTVIAQWELQHKRPIDIARVRGIKKENFFIEGLGAGVFPELMKAMSLQKTKASDAKGELRAAQKLFEETVQNYKPHFCNLIIDGKDYSGEYLLIEIMNMQAVGPRLDLALHADPSDGVLEIVLVNAEEQQKLAGYARLKHRGEEADYNFHSVKGKDIRIQWSGPSIHLDDQLIRTKKNTAIHIQEEPGLMLFFTDKEHLSSGK